MDQALLFVSATCIIPIALGYGARPATLVPWLSDCPPCFGCQSAAYFSWRHEALYLSLSGFCFLGALEPKRRILALNMLAVFVLGLAAGRVISLVLDGMPNNLLLLYLFMEVAVEILAVVSLSRTKPSTKFEQIDSRRCLLGPRMDLLSSQTSGA